MDEEVEMLLSLVGSRVSGITWDKSLLKKNFPGHYEATVIFTDGTRLHLGGNCYASLSIMIERPDEN